MYNYVHLGPPLLYLLSKMKIPIIQGNTVINLLDYMPILKQGFTTYNIIENMVDNYAKLHNHEDIGDDADQLFEEAFGSNIPATYVPTNAGKITMETAVERKLIPTYLNTYDLMAYLKGNDVLSYNLIASPIVNQYINNQNLIKQIKKEEQLEQVLSILLRSYNKYQGFIPLKDYVKAIYYPDTTLLLLNDNRINMYVAIILNDVVMVKSLLFNTYYDDNEAYALAVKYGNVDIINMIKNNIISRNWYGQQVFNSNFPYGTLKDDLYHYYKNI